MQYEAKKFNIPELKGISAKQLEVHLKLYEGYVKFTNQLRDTIADLSKDAEKNAYAIMEVRRRLGFEFDGMRMHEYYFDQWEGGASDANPESDLAKAVSEKYGDWNAFLEHFKGVGMTRGIGWTILYHDPKGDTPHVAWVGDHELGQLAGLPVILALDMWEHAFMVDYTPAEKKNYIEAFLQNLNWNLINKRFDDAK